GGGARGRGRAGWRPAGWGGGGGAAPGQEGPPGGPPPPVAAGPPPAAVAAAPAAPAAVLPGPGLVDGQGAAVVLLAVQAADGRLGLLVGAHLDEAEALAAPGVAVHDDLRRLHGAERLGHRLEVAAE